MKSWMIVGIETTERARNMGVTGNGVDGEQVGDIPWFMTVILP